MSIRRIVRRPQPAAVDDAAWPADWPELMRRVHAARGSQGHADAMPRLADLPPPDAMSGLADAVDLLRAAIADDRHIVVTADFDCDGATACAVAVRGLRMLGAKRVSFAVPDRAVHGYGLSPALVRHIAPLQPDLLLTVDHGIACHAGIAAARQQGWQVLVTDHHLPGETLPPADAIVNPNQPGDAFPGKALAGVGVLFYLLLAVRAAMRADGDAVASAADLGTLLDLVAVGTVADMVPLDRINRALIGAGLRRLRCGQGSTGLQALIGVAQRDAAVLTTADIGYAIAPRINAAGRLDDMTVGIACLLSDNAGEAHALAAMLDAINRERRQLQDAMVDSAQLQLPEHADGASPAICLHDPDWHAGVVGLVASKLKERFHRPALAFAPSGNGDGELRGSMRSIPGFHARDALALIDARHPGLIARFGGHAMAAGLSLAERHFAAFSAAFQRLAAEQLHEELLHERIDSDGELPVQAHDIQHALWLRDGGAWGQRYPEPVFDGVFAVLSTRIVGNAHLRLELERDGARFNAMHFGGADGAAERGDSIRIAYRLTPDHWRGGDAVQLIVVHRQPA